MRETCFKSRQKRMWHWHVMSIPAAHQAQASKLGCNTCMQCAIVCGSHVTFMRKIGSPEKCKYACFLLGLQKGTQAALHRGRQHTSDECWGPHIQPNSEPIASILRPISLCLRLFFFRNEKKYIHNKDDCTAMRTSTHARRARTAAVRCRHAVLTHPLFRSDKTELF